MSEKLRNRLTSYIGTAVIFMMVFGVMWQAMPVPVAHAVADTIVLQFYLDIDKDGEVDHIVLVFSENVTQCLYEAEDWTVNTSSEMNLSITGIDTSDPAADGNGVCDGTDAMLFLSVTSDADETNAATNPVISYDNDDADNSLQDALGNITNKTSLTISDQAAPALLTLTIQDSNSDGLIDTIVTGWSENVDTDDSDTGDN